MVFKLTDYGLLVKVLKHLAQKLLGVVCCLITVSHETMTQKFSFFQKIILGFPSQIKDTPMREREREEWGSYGAEATINKVDFYSLF